MSSYTLKVTLQHITPPIWRRLRIPRDATLFDLHVALQVAFGWQEAHLHEFRQGARRYGMSVEMDPTLLDDPNHADVIDEATVTVGSELRRTGAKMLYLYDFGDGWVHEIVVEAVDRSGPIEGRPPVACLAAKRAGPPEDCGGPVGYAMLLEALADPSHAEHQTMREWVGDDYDPERVRLRDINPVLRWEFGESEASPY